ncbi:restriction endonuclease [Brachyspira aalborgi]|jgi:5-methylcytosine-specific restriction enzyme subunit McrC|uniref:Restriction endonuclease n=1 Tax=Brachyspira aalborgi TaxID=29522 RepID=A0AB38PX41_9SPIR|nr:restriction endonuclease [Brachyspira aalborgi]MBS4763371.1 restriction endonuclease [Brachyspira sp.]TXJ14862.1 restriction endonuclease [Brachyspira aalborgi]TXJ18502.1 restriction endonuclease [Brachyspira aalborgi]TXJ24456.1 restriction endonuclease [Brachyspira aalborgi]TXJ32811.1 restriction endonuclease [Brachyspira aalborgi]
MNKCECDFCKKTIYKEHDEITCDLLEESITKSKYRNKLLTHFDGKKLFSYFIGAFWINDNENEKEKYTKSIIIKPKIENIDFMKMFSKCFEYSTIIKDFNEIYNIDFDEKPINHKDNKLMPDLDILIAFHFLRMLEVELHNGLKKNFIRREENLQSKIKGKIQFSKHINKNIIRGREDKIYCSYLDYDINCLENRILKRALKICASKISEIKNSLYFYCISFFNEVSDELSYSELNHIKINPLYKRYKLLIELAIKIIKLKRYKDSCNENEAPPFWIDMSLLFEKYVYALMLENIKGSEIIYQKSYYHNKFKPDFIIKGKKYNYIADTKYKMQYQNNKINKDDFRQLSGYSRVSKIVNEFKKTEKYIPKCLIIFPNNEADSKISFKDKYKIKGLVRFYKLGIKLPEK